MTRNITMKSPYRLYNCAIWCFDIERSSYELCRNTVSVISTLIMILIERVREDHYYMGYFYSTV
jgi:hypothetical protein